MTLENMREQIILMQQHFAKTTNTAKHEPVVLALYRARTELEKLMFSKVP